MLVLQQTTDHKDRASDRSVRCLWYANHVSPFPKVNPSKKLAAALQDCQSNVPP
jgi:hypothetical protein